MKTARLLAYGIVGVIAGLLVENTSLRLKAKASKKVRHIKKGIGKGN